MLRLGHALSNFCLTLFYHRHKFPLFLTQLFSGYAMAGRLRASALEKPEFTSGNCLTYVIAQRLRHGGNIVTIKSLYGWWCHAYWVSETGKVYEYAPVQPHRKVKKLWHPLPPLVYEGRERLAPKLPQAALRKVHALSQPRPVPADIGPAPALVQVSAAPVVQAAAA